MSPLATHTLTGKSRLKRQQRDLSLSLSNHFSLALTISPSAASSNRQGNLSLSLSLSLSHPLSFNYFLSPSIQPSTPLSLCFSLAVFRHASLSLYLPHRPLSSYLHLSTYLSHVPSLYPQLYGLLHPSIILFICIFIHMCFSIHQPIPATICIWMYMLMMLILLLLMTIMMIVMIVMTMILRW